MSFSPLDNHEGGSPAVNMPRVTMCLENELKEDAPKSENMKVFARVRPMLQKEKDEGYRDCIAAIDDETVRAVVPANSAKFKNQGLNPQDMYDFKYTQAFGPEIGQFVFFENTIMDAMLGFFEGQNSLIFNYGITNSGKTYTLQGNEANPGIIPLAMHLFFGCVESQLMEEICVKPDKYSDIVVLNDNERAQEYRLKEEVLRIVDNDSFNKTSGSDVSVVGKHSKSFSQVLCECFRDDFNYQTEKTLPPDEMIAAQSALYMRELGKKCVDNQPGKCNIWVSFIEIYNEYVYDLLQPNITQRQKLSLAEDQNGDVYIRGAREICVSNSMEAIKLMYVGRKNLRIASTKLNYQSSRSHCIFTVRLARVFEDEELGTSGRVNRISFCDLAGSERANKSHTTGIHLKEAGYINTSLMVLGRCLNQLRRNQTARDKKMIPFRESKLTRLFSNHFLGKGKAVMIANASPCEYTFDETFNVLRFSALAKDLAISDSYISMAQSSIVDICDQWQKSKNRVSVDANESSELDSSVAEELEEKDEIIEKLIDIAESLKNNLEQEKKEKRELEFKIREDVCNDYAAYSDELLDEQKKNYERQIESLRDIYQQRYNSMKDMYEERIQKLQADSESDESFENSISEANKTFSKIEESLITFSPAVGQPPKKEVKEAEFDTSMDFFDAEAGEENPKTNSDILSLKEDLESLTKELNITKQKLEETLKTLKESQTEGAIAKEKSDTLSCKLLEANQVLEEYQKEVEQLKTNCASCENEIDSLQGEKKDLQENVLSLSEQLAQSTAEAEQLKKEKLELEESYSEKLVESEKKIADLKVKYEGLTLKFEESVQALEHLKTKYNNLEEEYEEHKNTAASSAEGVIDLKEKLDAVSQQLVEALSEAEKFKKDKLEMVEDYCEKLQESEKKIAVLEEYAEKLKELKEKLASVSEELTQSTAEVEQLKKEKLEIEENYSQKLMESEKRNADLEAKCEELNCKLEESVQAMANLKTQYNKLEEEYAEFKNSTSSSAKDFTCLKEKLDTVSQQLAEALSESEQLKEGKLKMEADNSQNLEEREIKIAGLEEKCAQLNHNLEESAQDMEDMKLKYNKLEKECENLKELKEKFASVSEELTQSKTEAHQLKKEKLEVEEGYSQKFAERIGELEAKCAELNCKLEESVDSMANLKTKYNKLEEEYAEYKNSASSSAEDFTRLKEKLDIVSQQLVEALRESEQLKKEKLEMEEDRNQKLEEREKEIADLEEKCTQLTCKLEASVEAMEDVKTKCNEFKEKHENSKELKEKLASVSDELTQSTTEAEELKKEKLKIEESYSQKLAESEKNISDLEAKHEELNCKLEESAQALEVLTTEYDKLKEEFDEYKNSSGSPVEDFAVLKEKLDAVSQQLAEALSECEVLKNEKLKMEEDNIQKLEEKEKKIADLEEKCTQLNCKLEESVQTLEDVKTKCYKFEEEYEDLKELKEKLASVSEELTQCQSEAEQLKKEKLEMEEKIKLLEILEKCEHTATNKIKHLHSSSIKNVEILTDLSRQLREKESSIEELERALCECQKQLKESEARAKKQMNAIKQQHTVEIEEMAHLKKLVEEENLQLKSNVAEMEKEGIENDSKKEEGTTKEAEKRENLKRSTSSNVPPKGRKKRSMSEISKDETDNSLDKENSDRECLKDKAIKEKTVTKRRRVLRQRQEIEDSSNGESEAESSKPISKKIESDDDDYRPSKTTTRRRAPAKEKSRQPQKKTTTLEPKAPAARSSRRKLQEDTENVSPVKKALAYVGSKFKSVAQAVSDMPSPRITRGRRKLFNADIATPVEKKWKL